MTKQEIQHALELMATVLNEVDGYVVFGSAALYLHAQKHDIKELDHIPDDIDIAVKDEETLKLIRDRLEHHPEATLDNDGLFQSLETDDAIRVSGTIANVPFECFLHSLVIPEHEEEYHTRILGLQVLNIEGLRRQYIKCAELEERLTKNHVCKKAKLPERYKNIDLLKHLEQIDL